MLFAIIFFNDSFANIVTITFSALILIELLNVYSAVREHETGKSNSVWTCR